MVLLFYVPNVFGLFDEPKSSVFCFMEATYRKNIICIAFCVRVLGSLASAQERFPALDQYPDVNILESSESGVTFEFKPVYLPDRHIVSPDGEFEAVRFGHASSWDYNEVGRPDLRFRTVAIGLPGLRNNRVTVVSADYETKTGISLAPVPRIVPPSKARPEGLVYKKTGAVVDQFIPEVKASIAAIAPVKGVPVGYLRIFPVQYNSATGTLRKHSRLVVRVDFGPRERVSGPNDDDWMRASLVNYPDVRRWLQRRVPGLKKSLVNSVLSSGTWYKLEVRDDGMYKIDAAYLRTLGIDRSSLSSIRDLKLYGNNGLPLPADLVQPRAADLTPLAALYVDNNNNGKFDEDDYILFYAQGVTGWIYSAGQKEFSHYTNPYTSTNFYFLQYAAQGGPGKQMSAVQPPPIGFAVTSTTGKIFFHEERTNFNQSGQGWYSAPMNPRDSRVIANKLNGYVTGTPVRYNYEMLSRADVGVIFDIQESGKQIASLYVYPLTVSELDDAQSNYANSSSGQVSVVPSLADNRSTLKITYDAASSTAKGFINWVEIIYTQQLFAIDESLIFTSPDTTGAVQYALSGFLGNNFSVFDISDIADVKTMTSLPDQIAGTYSFRDNLATGGVKRYWVGTSAAYKTPLSFTRVPNSNLRGMTPGADFVIIAQRDFLADAQRLKTHKENLTGGDALQTAVVEIDTIYNEFGGGMPDPVAIRDFLKYATSQWQPAPRYVLFMGDASYDFKDILGIDRNWVPTYQTPESNRQIDTYGFDDFFAMLQPGNSVTVTLAHGRLAVRSVAEAKLSVDRIIRYESAPSFGLWRNLVTVVADDRNINGELDGAYNPEQAETLVESHLPKFFEVKKIYEEDYPTVIASAGRRKPDARQALLDQVNRGTLVLNFTGHGNPKVWAHESILTKEDVITQFFNADRLALIVAATCDWGRFDEAGEQSSAEEAMLNPSGGAIGVVSADRAVWSDDNAVTNYALYDFLFPTDPYRRTLRLGDGLMLAKNAGAASAQNNQKYHLLGDPTLRLAVPRLVVQVDSINGKPVGGGTMDTLRALSKVTIRASVRDSAGRVQNINSDSGLVSVFDAERVEQVYDAEVGHRFSFLKPGAVIYKGESSIRAGRLSATFIIPKDISYANKQGKISVYFSGDGTDGRGFTNRVIVGGTAPVSKIDTQGPTMEIFLDTRSFRSGDLVDENPMLIVDLRDSSGINSAGSGIGHRLEAWLDAAAKGIDLTEYYKGAKDNYQAGSVEFRLAGLSAGQHTLRVRAWDVYNNSSVDDANFIVASSTALALENVYNIPNPVRSTTTFTLQHNQSAGVDIEIKIYTVSGRLIQSISRYGYPERFVQIPWDCRDRDGAKVGNGTYLYKVSAKTADGRFASEALGKMSIVR